MYTNLLNGVCSICKENAQFINRNVNSIESIDLMWKTKFVSPKKAHFSMNFTKQQKMII